MKCFGKSSFRRGATAARGGSKPLTPGHATESAKCFRESDGTSPVPHAFCCTGHTWTGRTRIERIDDGRCSYWMAFLRGERQPRRVGYRARRASCNGFPRGFPGSGRRRERDSAGTGECERPQRLDQGPERHRQRIEVAAASTAFDPAGDAHDSCAAQLDATLAPARLSAGPHHDHAANAVRVVTHPAPCGPRRRQGK